MKTNRELKMPENFSELIFFPKKPFIINPINGITGISMKYLIINYYHFKIFISSIFIVLLFLKRDIIIANPIAASAAATVITKKTKICPVILPKNDENVTSDKLIAFSINSMHINIIIALRLTSTPITPVVNKTALSNKKKFISIIHKFKQYLN